MDAYPLLNFLVQHGRKLALVLGALTFVIGAIASVEQGAWLWALAGAGCAVVIYGFVASFAELVQLVTDMLLPK